MRTFLVFAAIALAAADHASAATVTIDETTEYQTIDGFGGFGGYRAEYSGLPQHSRSWAEILVNDLGLSIHRYFLNVDDIEDVNDNADPFSLDLTKFNTSGTFGTQIGLIQDLHELDPNIKFFFSVLSPPKWMKVNGDYVGQGDPDNRLIMTETILNEFAEHMVAYVKLAKIHMGIDLYGLSLQNEPRFAQFYASCVYTPQELHDLTAVVGPRFEAEGLTTRLMMGEDLLSNFGQFEGVIQSDPATEPYLKIFATHTYSDGVNPVPTSDQALSWNRPGKLVTATGKQFWMTETSGYDTDWDGAMTMAFGIYAALRYGKVTGWVYYRLHDFLTQSNTKTFQYHAARHYFRWVRPGAVMIDVASDDDEVHPLAFHHKDNNTLTVVAINYSSSTKTMSLTGGDLPDTYQMYRSTATEGCVDAGAVSASSVQLSGRSMVTLYAENYEPSSIGVETPRSAVPRATAGQCSVVYGIDGRRVGRVSGLQNMHSGGLPAGAYLVVPEAGTGAATLRSVR